VARTDAVSAFVVWLEGVAELQADIVHAERQLDADLREATLEAAAAGVIEAQQNHPYQDHRDPKKSARWRGAIGLTDTSHAEQGDGGSLRTGVHATMVWPADYASYVDKGTSRARAFPFTAQAEKVAEEKLEEGAARAVEKFTATVGR